jgi:hypothetical protein
MISLFVLLFCCFFFTSLERVDIASWILNGSIFTTKGLYLYRITFPWLLRERCLFVKWNRYVSIMLQYMLQYTSCQHNQRSSPI